MNISKLIKTFFSIRRPDDIYTDQFYVTLNTYYEDIPDERLEKKPEIKKQIDELFQQETWENAYQIEQLLTLLFDKEAVEVELERRMVEAEEHLEPELYTRYKEMVAKSKGIEDKRSILSRLVNDLQWYYTKKHNILELSNRARLRICIGFLLSIGFFIFMLTLCVLNPNYQLNFVFTYIAAGIWGASFSNIVNIEKRTERSGKYDIRVLQSRGYILSRYLIGLGAALILLFFLQAELLTGTLFPQFNIFKMSNPAPIDFSLLIVWCFIAGFSENFVPNLLSKTQEKIEIKEKEEKKLKQIQKKEMNEEYNV